MGRALSLLAALAALLACTATAALAGDGPRAGSAAEGAGHNVWTERLEAAFKVALYERAGRDDGCYQPPAEMAATIAARSGRRTLVAGGFNAVRRDLVYVIKRGTSCSRVVLATRGSKGRTFVLDSVRGPVYILGKVPKRDRQEEPGQAGPLRGISLVTKSFQMSAADDTKRFDVICPSKKYPLGGGFTASPAPGPDGEGVYPHSYERLGAQRGFHVSPVVIDPSPASTAPRRVTLQAMCGRGLVPTDSPHKTVFLVPGQSKSVTARCPKGTFLFSGGFQRTDFRTQGGDYATESRAVGQKAWRASGRAFGEFGGELTAIAHCVRSKRPLLTQVSGTSTVAAGANGTATAGPCPKGRRLTSGGFSTGSFDTFFATGIFGPGGTWSVSAFGYFGPAPALTAYGYCLRPGV